MPDPARYKNTEEGYKKFIRDCMHQTLHKEKKEKEQSIAQCLNMWRKEHGHRHPGKAPKKMIGKVASDFLSLLFNPPPVKKYACPRCAGNNAIYVEEHPDTDMNEMVLKCPDCRFRG